jgi:hypothetical protein
LTEEELEQFGSKLLYNWISHHDYVQDLFKINTLIIGAEVPTNLQVYINEAKKCYAFQQYNAVLSLCRTILETAAKDLKIKIDNLTINGAEIIAIDPSVFNQLIGAVASGSLKKRAVKIYYKEACPVMHGDNIVNQNDAAKVFHDTIVLIEELYDKHGF